MEFSTQIIIFIIGFIFGSGAIAFLYYLFNSLNKPEENKNEDLEETINKICERVSDAINEGNTLIVLSDRGVSGEMAAIPSLLILAAVHHDLIRRGLRSKAGLIVESGEPREVMHFALLLGYGAAAINPYLAYATLDSMLDKKEINVKDLEYAVLNYKKAIHKGLLKIAS